MTREQAIGKLDSLREMCEQDGVWLDLDDRAALDVALGLIRSEDLERPARGAADAAVGSASGSTGTSTPAEPPKMLPWEQDFGQPSQAARDADAAENYRKGWQAGCASVAPTEPQTPEPLKLSRIEVIDQTGRLFVKYADHVELSWQDDGTTLKAFIHGPRVEPAAPVSSARTLKQNVVELREKWASYRRQEPRTFNAESVDETAVARENTLMEIFIRDLDALLSGGHERKGLGMENQHELSAEHLRRQCACYAVTYDLAAKPDGLWLSVSVGGRHVCINLLAEGRRGMIGDVLQDAWRYLPDESGGAPHGR